jgi:branched-subunit amino acid aminotransferase/4-amino-4-deoxychorismate lyase
MAGGALLGWDSSTGLCPRPPDDGKLLAADSWLVYDGRCRGLSMHRDRFLLACRAAGAATSEVVGFWTAVIACLPRSGTWFPRVEAVAGHHGAPIELRVRIRAALPSRQPVRLHVWSGPDPRRVPRCKGPDLARLSQLHAQVATRPTDEVLLTTARDVVLETTSGSILWWEGEQLCFPAPSLRLLPGVTARMIQQIARESGMRIRPRLARVAQLHERECWVVNALHGIRAVNCWADPAMTAGQSHRAAIWQALLERRAESLPRQADQREGAPWKLFPT